MESAAQPVSITWVATVDNFGMERDVYWFILNGVPAKLWTGPHDHTLRPGDRVKITITKEPDPNAKP